MTGTRLSTRTELKDNLMDIYSSINEGRPFDALNSVDSAELNVTVYFNTRGLNCEHFIPIFQKIRVLLRRYSTRPLYKRQLYEQLFTFSNELRATSVSKMMSKTDSADPILSLRYIADDLIDDYSAFNPTTGGQEIVEQNRQILDLIKDDLLEMRELEPLFQNQSEILKMKYNILLKEIHKCLMVLPQAKDITISSTTAKTFRTYFETLFAVLTDIFVPVEQKSEGVAEESTEEQIPKEKKKPVERTTVEKENVNLEELEKKAKESRLDGTNIPAS
ncbi:MAG: hypothetical protein IMZ53_10535 [Thermoplasmata archaeon]|nr:hypothetical protein [Thermoplasmata archaeon]